MSPGGTAGRVLNDVGLALWLAAATAPRGPGAPRWPAWTWPSVAAHLAGATMVTVDNRGPTTALTAVLGEQQRPATAARGVLRRLARM